MADTVQITELSNVAMASILSRKGVDAERIGRALSMDAPNGPSWSAADGALTLLGSGPSAWLAQQQPAPAGWIDDLQARLVDVASVSDQSGAYRLFRIEGPGARKLLQRGVAIDLHETAFPVSAVAVTFIAHIDVILRRLPGDDAYELAVFRSYAESFGRWLDAAVSAL